MEDHVTYDASLALIDHNAASGDVQQLLLPLLPVTSSQASITPEPSCF
jgi:hypothetical protein